MFLSFYSPALPALQMECSARVHHLEAIQQPRAKHTPLAPSTNRWPELVMSCFFFFRCTSSISFLFFVFWCFLNIFCLTNVVFFFEHSSTVNEVLLKPLQDLCCVNVRPYYSHLSTRKTRRSTCTGFANVTFHNWSRNWSSLDLDRKVCTHKNVTREPSTRPKRGLVCQPAFACISETHFRSFQGVSSWLFMYFHVFSEVIVISVLLCFVHGFTYPTRHQGPTLCGAALTSCELANTSADQTRCTFDGKKQAVVCYWWKKQS